MFPVSRRTSTAVRVSSLALATLFTAGLAGASSHREAPGITEMPKVDGTDFYAFRSYEAGRAAYITLIANYLPLQDAYGGPNYFALDPDAAYRIHIDNTGDGVEDITFQFLVRADLRDIQVARRRQAGLDSADQRRPDHRVPTPPSRTLRRATPCGCCAARSTVRPASSARRTPNGGGFRFNKPVDYIGQKSIPNYDAYADQFIQGFNVPGCSGQVGRVFVGQRQESFAVNLGEIFDLVNITNPLGAARRGTVDDRRQEHHLAGDRSADGVPRRARARCSARGPPRRCRRNRVLTTNPTFKAPAQETGPRVQVSRLGMPLVNEVVIGVKDKNKFNASKPKDDLANFADYVTNPTLPELLELLFGSAGVRAPNNFPRTDLVAAFVTGVDGPQQVRYRRDAAPQHLDRTDAGRGAEQPRRIGRRQRRFPQWPPPRR